MRDSGNALIATSPAPVALPPLAPGRTANVGIVVAVPKTPGEYKVTIGLVDPNGNGLAKLGAATASFQLRAHQPYIVSATIGLPSVLHSGEASLFVTKYAALPTAGSAAHTLTLAWRLIDTKTNRSVAQGAVPLGALQPGSTGSYYAPFVAPAVLGTYRLAYDVRERNVAASETFTSNVTIVGPRTYPDDEGGRTPPAITIAPRASTPSPTPRMRFPSPTSGVVPDPQLPALPVPRGRTSTPAP
jgi:hypothetical protein